MIDKNEIISSLSETTNYLNYKTSIEEYANKLLKLGNFIVYRDSENKLISYLAYYDNLPEIFISMIWTDQKYRKKGFEKKMIQKLIKSNQKNINLQVHRKNPALSLYHSLGFRKKSEHSDFIFMERSKQIAIMQPYIFPYIGYFNLIEACDLFVFYDDVNYIKRGWINRNRILLNDKDFLFSIPVEKASQNKLIKEIAPKITPEFLSKFKSQIESGYKKKSPYYKDIYDLINLVFSKSYESISDLAINSIEQVYKYIDKPFIWVKSSDISPETKGIDRADRLIAISKKLGFSHYVNSIGGQELYEKEYFNSLGINLNFVKPIPVKYNQKSNTFIPSLSIIDILMFNSPKEVNKLLCNFEVI
uniref:WbqC family protein n=1 Tax=Ornithobacterium rhinotracheale TaxID=28251 RepID=UPI0039A6350F